MSNYRKVTLQDGTRALIYIEGQEGKFQVAVLLEVLNKSWTARPGMRLARRLGTSTWVEDLFTSWAK